MYKHVLPSNNFNFTEEPIMAVASLAASYGAANPVLMATSLKKYKSNAIAQLNLIQSVTHVPSLVVLCEAFKQSVFSQPVNYLDLLEILNNLNTLYKDKYVKEILTPVKTISDFINLQSFYSAPVTFTGLNDLLDTTYIFNWASALDSTLVMPFAHLYDGDISLFIASLFSINTVPNTLKDYVTRAYSIYPMGSN